MPVVVRMVFHLILFIITAINQNYSILDLMDYYFRIMCYFNPFVQDRFPRGKYEKLHTKHGKRKSASADNKKTLTLQGLCPAAMGPRLRYFCIT